MNVPSAGAFCPLGSTKPSLCPPGQFFEGIFLSIDRSIFLSIFYLSGSLDPARSFADPGTVCAYHLIIYFHLWTGYVFCASRDL